MQFAALHPETRLLLNSWQNLNRENNVISEQREAKSRDAATLVDRLFMANRLGDGIFTFTTVGKDLKLWTGRDLKDHEIGSIFYGPDKTLIRSLLEAAVSQPGPALARLAAFGAGHGQRTEIEMVFLPLIDKGGPVRILGLFQPIAPKINISRPALRFSLTALLPPSPQQPANPGLRIVS